MPETPLSRTTRPARRLRALLTLNGASNAVGGIVLLPLAGVLDGPLGLPATAIAAISVFYVVYGAAMWFTATRSRPPGGATVALIAVNPIWAVTCLLLAAGDLGGPTTLGVILLVAEAGIVTTLAVLESLAYRRARVPERPAAGEPVRA